MTDATEQAPGIGHNSASIEEILQDTRSALMARVEPLAERANSVELPNKKIESEDHLALITPIVVDAKALAKDLENARKDDKQPYLDGGRAVDAFFKGPKDRLDRIVGVFERLASDFQREKIAEERRRAEEAERRAEAEAERLRKEAETAKKPETQQRKLDKAAEADNAADRAAAAAQRSGNELGKVSTAGGTARAQTFWNYAIENYGELDLNSIRDFIDREAVEKAIRAKIKIQKGNTEIPGVRVFEDVKASIR